MRRLVWMCPLILCMAVLPALLSNPRAEAQASWQTSAPREPVPLFSVVELGVRNKWGEPGECYFVAIEVYDPAGEYVAGDTDWVCGDEWTYWEFDGSSPAGTYTIYCSIDGEVIAVDWFDVYA